ncbi:hypothetical protein [Pendulispora albinea]|uniref:Uncharacterized protein n=1 Tax=Pendulispora albinea TaxID=2741071 RepID=A0ABZ2LYS9_9BACT
MQRSFAGSKVKSVRLSFDLFMAIAPTGKRPPRAISMRLKTTSSENRISLLVKPEETVLEEFFKTDTGKQYINHGFGARRPEIGRWAHIDIGLTNAEADDGVDAGAARRLTASMDGTSLIDHARVGDGTLDEIALFVGILEPAEWNEGWRYHYDNIVFDAR